jgi:hypothetical protein
VVDVVRDSAISYSFVAVAIDNRHASGIAGYAVKKHCLHMGVGATYVQSHRRELLLHLRKEPFAGAKASNEEYRLNDEISNGISKDI